MDVREGTTIAAVSTPAGVGGIGIVRLSGPKALAVAGRVFCAHSGKELSRMAGYTSALGRVFNAEGELDDAIAFVYRAPKSYTGEDVVELSCHGGVWVVRQLLRACLDAGAAPAGPGEFTMRAYLNGKMDLAQAEAVAGIITAESDAALRTALAGRDGSISLAIGDIVEALKTESAHLAAWADYPEEDLVPVDSEQLAGTLAGTLEKMKALLAGWDRGKAIRDGVSAAIIGKPNVGKSTLMNLLLGEERSIVTDLPGTTRDVVRESAHIGDFVLHLADTAGIHDTLDPVESIGVARSRQQIEIADLVLVVLDSSGHLSAEDVALLEQARGKPCIAILNKNDLPTQIELETIKQTIDETVFLSARTGEGRGALEAAITKALGLAKVDPAAPTLANERQRACLQRAARSVEEAAEQLAAGMTLDIINLLIDEALEALLSLTGQRVNDVVVEAVFSRFCVGK